MFEELIKTLNALQGEYKYNATIETDEEGYWDKECPNPNCLSKFKIKADDWRDKVSDEKVYCPYCGHTAPAESWFTTEQVEAAKEEAEKSIVNQINSAIQKDTRRFNARQKKGFITMSLKASGCEQYPLLSIKALELMEQKITCSKCGCSYSVVGPSMFCPCCGYSSPKKTFENSMGTINSKLKMVSALSTLDNGLSKDENEAVKQSLLKSSLSELVGAFQVLCTEIFNMLYPSVRLRKNVFQRIDDGNALWKDNAGIEYKNFISVDELNDMKLYFQQRHLLEHNKGIVDAEYLQKSADASYNIGQSLIIKESDVKNFLSIISKLGNAIIASQLN